MNRILKVGDRVRNVRGYEDEPAIIIDESTDRTYRLKIEYLKVLNVSGSNVRTWVNESDITLDIEYYRNLKIENILK